MREEEIYRRNRNKISIDDISTWKYFPSGEVKRKIYDYHFLPLSDFLSKYYVSFPQKEFWTNQWMNAIVFPAFDNDIEKLSKRLGKGITSNFSFDEMHQTFSKLKNVNYLEDDVKLFVSWMSGMHFFEKQGRCFNEWINSKNYNTGGRHYIKPDIYTIKEIAQFNHGNNLLREKLMELEWHKR